MKMMAEFREFALRGNAFDMAIGIVVGAAFATVVSSLVADVFLPPIGMVAGGIDLADHFWVLRDGEKVAGPYLTLEAAKEAGAITVNLGAFANAVISFLIVAWIAFLITRAITTVRRGDAEKPSVPPEATREEALLAEIRDLLKAEREPKPAEPAGETKPKS